MRARVEFYAEVFLLRYFRIAYLGNYKMPQS